MENKNKSEPLTYTSHSDYATFCSWKGTGVRLLQIYPQNSGCISIFPLFTQYCPSIPPSFTSTKLYLAITTNHEAPLYAIFSSLSIIPHTQAPIYPSTPYSHTPPLHATSQIISHIHTQ